MDVLLSHVDRGLVMKALLDRRDLESLPAEGSAAVRRTVLPTDYGQLEISVRRLADEPDGGTQ